MGGLEYNLRDNRMEIVAQEDFVQEHRIMACNWQAKPGVHRISCTHLYIQKPKKVVYITYYIICYIHTNKTYYITCFSYIKNQRKFCICNQLWPGEMWCFDGVIL